MKDKALTKVVKDSLPSIIGRVAPDMTGGILEIAECISNIPAEYFRSKAMMTEAIAGLGEEWLQYSAPIAEKIVECVSIAEVADCRKSEIIINAIFDDEGINIADKIDTVIKWENSEHERKMKMAKMAVIGACTMVAVGGISVALVRASPRLAMTVPWLLKSNSDNKLKRDREVTKMEKVKEKEQTKREKKGVSLKLFFTLPKWAVFLPWFWKTQPDNNSEK